MPSHAGIVAAGRSHKGRGAYTRGLRAESRVCQTLENQGWTVLERRVRTAAGEIDIVARLEAPASAPLIAFIEVKARPLLVDAAHALTAAQQNRLVQAAAIMLAGHPEWAGFNLRFDLVLIDRSDHMRRIVDAFRIGDD